MQIIANGAIQGLVIAVLALGFNSVYLPTRVFFFALGGIYAAAPYLVWQACRLGCPWPIAVIFAIIAGAASSAACEWLNHRPLQRSAASAPAHFVSSLGLYVVLVQIVALIWGNQTRTFRTGVETATLVGGVMFTRSQLLEAGISVVLIAGYFTILQWSKLGLQFRALANNPDQLALYGYNVDRLRLVGFATAGLLGVAASLLQAYDVGFDPHAGLDAVLLAIVAVIVGGRYSFVAPVIGGVAIGLLRAEVEWYFSVRWEEAATFLLLVLTLFFRPNGLLGASTRLDAME